MRLGASGAYGPAAVLLAHFTGVTMHGATLRRQTVAADTVMQQLALAESTAAWADGAQATPAADPAVPLQVSVDGSMVHLRWGLARSQAGRHR